MFLNIPRKPWFIKRKIKGTQGFLYGDFVFEVVFEYSVVFKKNHIINLIRMNGNIKRQLNTTNNEILKQSSQHPIFPKKINPFFENTE